MNERHLDFCRAVRHHTASNRSALFDVLATRRESLLGTFILVSQDTLLRVVSRPDSTETMLNVTVVPANAHNFTLFSTEKSAQSHAKYSPIMCRPLPAVDAIMAYNKVLSELIDECDLQLAQPLISAPDALEPRTGVADPFEDGTDEA
jgi:hypothetical protein